VPNIRSTDVMAASTIVPNVVAGSAYEFLRTPARVQVWITQEAGAALGDVTAQVQFGPEVALEVSDVPTEIAAGRGPITDDPPLSDEIVAAGDRILLRLTNTDAAAPHTARTIVRIVNLA